MKTTARLIGLILLTGVLLSGCSSNTARLQDENAALKAELAQVKAALALKEQTGQELTRRQDAAKAYTDLYKEPLSQDAASPGGLSYIENVSGAGLDASYSIEEPIQRVEQVRGFLRSFADLTEKSKKYFSKSDLEKVGNTDWEMQTLGFNNIPIRIEGALREQNYIVKKLDLGLAIKQFEAGEIEETQLEEKARAFKTARSDYLNFAKNTNLAD